MLADGNLLIAFKHIEHADHSRARKFFAANPKVATCPITELNLVRGLMQLGYTGDEADTLLSDFIAKHRTEFLADDISATAIKGLCQGHRETTDAYLAKLAEKHRLKIATLDSRFAPKFPGLAHLVK